MNTNKSIWEQRATKGNRDKELYTKWHNMKSRCKGWNPQQKEYYADVSYDPRWEVYEAFADDITDVFEAAKEQYGPNVPLSIDRIDPFGDYVLDNIRFISRYESGINKRTEISFTHLGLTLRLRQWARMYKIPENVLEDRLRKGWAFPRALNEPAQTKTTKRIKSVD